jgi:energy-coupling factor transporter transmembrane protein EcfT
MKKFYTAYSKWWYWMIGIPVVSLASLLLLDWIQGIPMGEIWRPSLVTLILFEPLLFLFWFFSARR